MKKQTKVTTDRNVLAAVVNALHTKKEIKVRVQNGESLRKVVEEKGMKIVLPL